LDGECSRARRPQPNDAAKDRTAPNWTVLNRSYVGVSEGAEIAVGGGRLTEGALAGGFFLEPTVMKNVGYAMRSNSKQAQHGGPSATISCCLTRLSNRASGRIR